MSSNTGLKYEGTVVFIGQTEVVSDKFQKRQIVLSDKTSEYPQEIVFEFNQGKCSELDGLVNGSLVTVHYNLKGKLWKDNKWFNVLNGWKVEKSAFSKPAPNIQAENHDFVGSNDSDPLPF